MVEDEDELEELRSGALGLAGSVGIRTSNVGTKILEEGVTTLPSMGQTPLVSYHPQGAAPSCPGWVSEGEDPPWDGGAGSLWEGERGGNILGDRDLRTGHQGSQRKWDAHCRRWTGRREACC